MQSENSNCSSGTPTIAIVLSHHTIRSIRGLVKSQGRGICPPSSSSHNLNCTVMEILPQLYSVSASLRENGQNRSRVALDIVVLLRRQYNCRQWSCVVLCLSRHGGSIFYYFFHLFATLLVLLQYNLQCICMYKHKIRYTRSMTGRQRQ